MAMVAVLLSSAAHRVQASPLAHMDAGRLSSLRLLPVSIVRAVRALVDRAEAARTLREPGIAWRRLAFQRQPAPRDAREHGVRCCVLREALLDLPPPA